MVTLREERDGRDVRDADAVINPDGDLMVTGQDLGPTVERFWGGREYEWGRLIAARHLRALAAALGARGSESVLKALERWCDRHSLARLPQLLEDHGIPSQFWSRIGD